MDSNLRRHDLAELPEIAARLRRHIVRTVHTAGAGHLGGALSAADIVAALYFHVLRIDPTRPDWEDRDRFLISKGHACLVVYAALAERGYLPVEELATFDQINSRLQGHPDMLLTPGLEMSTGSLGQGLSVGIGIALGARLLGKDFHTYVLIGDGESQEGQIWEAAAVAARYGLDNLTAILDWNHLQQYGWHRPGDPQSMRQPPEADPVAKWRAFGWETIETDGHDTTAVVVALNKALATRGRPAIVIARTVKGKGVSFMENNYLWHASPLNDTQVAAALAELEARQAS